MASLHTFGHILFYCFIVFFFKSMERIEDEYSKDAFKEERRELCFANNSEQYRTHQNSKMIGSSTIDSVYSQMSGDSSKRNLQE